MIALFVLVILVQTHTPTHTHTHTQVLVAMYHGPDTGDDGTHPSETAAGPVMQPGKACADLDTATLPKYLCVQSHSRV